MFLMINNDTNIQKNIIQITLYYYFFFIYKKFAGMSRIRNLL